jgi:hypothetical protein
VTLSLSFTIVAQAYITNFYRSQVKHRRHKNSNKTRDRSASGGGIVPMVVSGGGIVPIMATNGGIFAAKAYGDSSSGGSCSGGGFRRFADAEALCGNIRGHFTSASGLFSQKSLSTGNWSEV